MRTSCVLFLAALWTAVAVAQPYPSKPVRIVVPYAAGGLPDTMGRLVSQRLTESLGQQFIIDNRPGAGGIGAWELVAKAPADGYTLLVADVSQTAINLIDPVGSTPEAYAAQTRIDIEKYARAVKAAGVKAE